MAKPRIGLTPRYCDPRFGKDGVNHDYSWAVSKSGGIPYMLCLSEADLDHYADDMDGLLVTGGEDINQPLLHQADKRPLTLDDRYDLWDQALIEAFAKRNKPIFGVCRGLQIINVVYGGTLFEDIDQCYKDLKGAHKYNDPSTGLSHAVSIRSNSRLHKICKQDTLMINSYHHQAIRDLAKGFTVSAISADGVIEAIEKDRILAVQWHPEKIYNLQQQAAIFDYFIQLAAQ